MNFPFRLLNWSFFVSHNWSNLEAETHKNYLILMSGYILFLSVNWLLILIHTLFGNTKITRDYLFSFFYACVAKNDGEFLPGHGKW